MDESEPIAALDARYGAPDARPTPWAQTLGVIRDAELFWLSTVRADGRPHVTPLPAVWRDSALHFCTGAGEQKAVNLAHDAHCALTTGTNRWKSGLDVVVEGLAERVTDEHGLQRLADAWEADYDGDWHFDVADGAFVGAGGVALVFAVRPTKVLAFAKGDFAQTRYRFARSR
jgi:general stress protein 26